MEKKLRLPVRPGLVVQLRTEVQARQVQEWKHALVGKFIDELPPCPLATEDAVTRLWQPTGAVRVIPFSRDRYVFKLDSADDSRRILAGSPYSVDGKLIVLQQLPTCTAVEHVRFNRAPVWITLTGLPVDLQCHEVALALAESAGHPTEADVVLGCAASGLGRVRVRVEIEAEEPLLMGTYVDDRGGTLLWVCFEYEGIPRICRNCMCIGHLEGGCKKTPIQAKYQMTRRLEEIAKRTGSPIVNDPAAEVLFGNPKSHPMPIAKANGSAGAIVPAGEAAAAVGMVNGRTTAKRRAAATATAQVEKIEDDDDLMVLPLSWPPGADIDGLDSLLSSPSTVAGPDETLRAAVGKKKYRVEKAKK